jgi:hypothetical protein
MPVLTVSHKINSNSLRFRLVAWMNERRYTTNFIYASEKSSFIHNKQRQKKKSEKGKRTIKLGVILVLDGISINHDSMANQIYEIMK